MKLIYCWIENYKNIKKTGFSFSDEYNITIENESNNYNLKIDENDKNIQTLLFGNNISLTAIVGNNGVGKSTILDLIRITLFDPKRMINKKWGFCIWRQGNKFIKNQFCSESIIVNGLSIDEMCAPKKFDLIYYSDSLDIKHYNDDFDDGENIETSIDEDDYWDEDEDITTKKSFRERLNNIMFQLLIY